MMRWVKKHLYWLWIIVPIVAVIVLLAVKPSGRVAKPEETIGFCVLVAAFIINSGLNEIANAIKRK